MNQKKTILIAVMANAGLLVVLFIAALSPRNESPSNEVVAAPALVSSAPLLPHEEIPLEPKMLPSTQENAIAMNHIAEEPKAHEVTHRLPPPEEVKAPKVVPALKEPAKQITQVTVKKGDSLAKIAKAHNTTVEEISKLNHLTGSFLKIGQQIKIPEKKNLGSKTSTSPIAEKTETTPEYYTVKAGDSPWGIAMKHHMKMEDLIKLNHLDDEKARKLKPGDRLRIR